MCRVLVIDDSSELRSLLVRVLRLAGHEVAEAAGGDEGLRVACVRRPDVVLVDILMPVHDGIETIRDLKASHPGVAIIAMSGGGMIDGVTYLRMASVLGANATLTKPFSF